jgi:hypothetical protein
MRPSLNSSAGNTSPSSMPRFVERKLKKQKKEVTISQAPISRPTTLPPPERNKVSRASSPHPVEKNTIKVSRPITPPPELKLSGSPPGNKKRIIFYFNFFFLFENFYFYFFIRYFFFVKSQVL